MKKLIFLLILLIPLTAFAQPIRGKLLWTDPDGTPTQLPFYEITVSSGTLADDGDGTGTLTTGGGGDVTSASNITDHSIVRGDGGVKGVQESGILIDDSDNMTIPSGSNLTVDTTTFFVDGTNNYIGIGTTATNTVNQLHFLMTATKDILIDGSTNPREIDTGVMRFEHKPNIDDTRCITFNVDNNSRANTHIEVINFLATGFDSVSTLYDANIDTTGSTAGVIRGYEVSQTGTGSAVIHGFHVDPGVIALHQESGTVIDVEQAWDENGGFTDTTTAFNSTVTDVTLFDADNDNIYLGMAATFNVIQVVLDTEASGAGIKATFGFSNGSGGFTAFSPDDNTRGFRDSGTITWITANLAGWATDTVNAVASKYWIKITRTANALTTPPIEDTIKPIAAVAYSWDEDGDVTIRGLTVDTNTLFVDSGNNRVGIGTTGPAQKLDIAYGFLRFTLIPNPTTYPSVALAGVDGNVDIGEHFYEVVFVTALGQTSFTGRSPNAVTTVSGNKQVNITDIPVSSNSLVTARKIYRTKVAGIPQFYLLTTINDNATTTYTDNTADASLSSTDFINFYYSENTTGGIIYSDTNKIFFAGSGSSLFVGYRAGQDITTGTQNHLLGWGAGENISTGSSIIAIGYEAAKALRTGINVTAIGTKALTFATSGSNTAIGNSAGRSITTGSNNTFIGDIAGSNVSQLASAENSMALGNGTYTTASNQVVIGNTDITETLLRGNVGIGTTSPDVDLDVEGSTGISIGEDKAGGGSNDEGILRLWSDGDNAFSTTIKTGTQTQNITYTLPLDDGDANEVMSTNGAGVLDWVAGGAGFWTDLAPNLEPNDDGDGIQINDSTGNDFVVQSHDGTDYNFVSTNTTQYTFDLPIQIGGTAQSTFTEGLVVNSGGGADEDDDFIVQTDTEANAFECDAGDNACKFQVPVSFSGNGDITLPAGSVDAGTYAAASIDGDDINSNLAGRSLTLTAASPDTLDIDVEIYTEQSGAYIESPIVEDLDDIFWFMNNVTITYVWAMTDTGTVTFNLNDGTNDILSSDLVADAGGQTSCASGCDVNTINLSFDNITAKTENIDIDISATASSPTKVSIYVGYTKDD